MIENILKIGKEDSMISSKKYHNHIFGYGAIREGVSKSYVLQKLMSLITIRRKTKKFKNKSMKFCSVVEKKSKYKRI